MNIKKTQEFAVSIRKKTLSMVHHSRSSHIGGAFSMADILAVLYTNVLTIDPNNSKDSTRDRFLLSKGHACSSLYATLGLKGFFPIEDLDNYAVDGSRFLSHTSHYIPGVEISAGSLGHALSVSCGLAIAAKRKNELWKTFCLISDGELNEGSNWEVLLLVPKLKIDNLIVIVDYNKIQSLGFVKDVIDLEPIALKFQSFGWETFEIDGHDHAILHETLIKCKNSTNGTSKIVIAHTVKGKGVEFMENKLKWHYKSPDRTEYDEALQCLNNSINSADQ